MTLALGIIMFFVGSFLIGWACHGFWYEWFRKDRAGS